MPLTTIDAAKDSQQTYQPLLLTAITWPDGTTLRLATHPLMVSEGGFQYGGNNYQGRVLDLAMGPVQGFDAAGVDVVPWARLTIADADKLMWTTYELGKGFAGATLLLTFVFWDADTSTFSSDSIVKFNGICDPGQADEGHLIVSATSKMSSQRRSLPSIPLQRRCPWLFPANITERTEGANNEDSPFFACGYSPDVGGGNARGNGSFTTCAYTVPDCQARGMYKLDSLSRVTGRFGGVAYDPPAGGRSREYTTGDWLDIQNNPNTAKYGRPIPLVYGTAWVEGIPVSTIGDGNSTRGEAILCSGEVSEILKVVVNDTELQRANDITGGTNYLVTDALLRYNVINRGDRDGAPNADSPWGGNGDPYGSLCTILWVVPRAVADAAGLPRIRALVQGPKIRVYTSAVSFTKLYTANPVWILLDLLIRGGWTYSEIDLQTFVDAAAVCDVTISYTDQFGNSATHSRFSSSLVISRKRPLSDIIRGFRQSFGGLLIPNSSNGQLQLFLQGTLASQQPAIVAGSNYNTPISSKSLTGATVDGYVAYDFTKFLLRNGRSTFRAVSSQAQQMTNRVSLEISNSEREYAQDSVSVIETEAVARIDQEVSERLDADGINTLDQAKRIARRRLAERLRGNGRNDAGGTELYEFEYSFGVVRLRAGHICRLSNAHYGLSNILVRVLQIEPDKNYETAKLLVSRHKDDWYLDAYGQDPDDRYRQLARDREERPSFAWGPREVAAIASDPLYPTTEYLFGLQETHEMAADGSSIAKLDVTGKQPVNLFSTLQPPLVGRQGTTAGSGGTIAGGGWSYYAVVVAKDANGLLSAPSSTCEVVITGAGSSHTLTVPVVNWETGTSGYVLYVGRSPNRMTKQAEAAGTPSSITITAFNEADYGSPDPEFDRMRMKVKVTPHVGVFGAALTGVAANTLTIAGAGWTTDQWANYDVILVAKADKSVLPLATFRVSANDADDLTVSPNPVTVGVVPGDVVVMMSRPTVGSDGGGNFLQDDNWLNTLSAGGLGLTVDEEKGRLLRIIRGPGSVNVYRIKSNTSKKIYIDGDWLVTPTVDSRYLIEEADWKVVQTTDTLDNRDPTAPLSVLVEISNYLKQTVLVQAFTVDGGGHESLTATSPLRVIYVQGQEGTGGISDWESTVILLGTLADHLGTDVTNHGEVRVDADVEIELVDSAANVKDPATGSDIRYDWLYSDDEKATWTPLFPSGLSNKGKLTAGEFLEVVSNFQAPVPRLLPGWFLRFDLLQIGSSNPGSDLTVILRGRKVNV